MVPDLPSTQPDREAIERSWLVRLIERRNANIAAVALANKTARIAWALLGHDRDYRADHRLVQGAA
jgi:transposase